ncbi:MAG TPA: MarR family transcriptional regulator [Solirubrobacteraceae bacterium]|nr:MarR family transcriptional regulator [Solirubrobacteraceae bacterium]
MDPPDIKFKAWYAALQASLRSLDRIARDVENETGIPLSWYEVLIYLAKCEDDQRRRMSELAESLLVSRGGATRIVARMEEEGLVRREIPPENRRVTYAVLTPKGLRTAERVRPVHEAAVRRHFTDAFGERDAERLRDVSIAVLEGLGEEHVWLIEDLQGARAEGR